jgi:hypothetical protein
MIESGIELQVYRCSCSVFPTCFSSGEQTTAAFEHSGTNLLADSCPYEASYCRGLVHAGTLTYGVAAASAYQHLCGHPSDNNVLIRFWPSSIVRSEPDGDSHLVVGDAKGHNIHIPGTLRFGGEFYLSFSANCGTTVAVITNRDGIEPEPSRICTHLVRYVAGMVSMHELILPSSVSVAKVCCIVVDDHRGTVYLLDTHGILHCIPYA